MAARKTETAELVRREALDLVPQLIGSAGPRARRRFLEFFAAQLRTENTRRAYSAAVRRFAQWCDEQGLALEEVEPVAASGYIASLLRDGLAVPTVKQHLAALRSLCDYLVTGHVLDFNPFAPVRGPSHQVRKGKTHALSVEEVRALFEAIDDTTVVGLRDQAVLATMAYAFARVSAVAKLRVRDYQSTGRSAFLALREKGGKHNRVPCHHKLAEAIDAYAEAAELDGRDKPLFRASAGRSGRLTGRPMARNTIFAMVRRRAADAGLNPEMVCNHSFRASGITNFMANGGALEVAASLANHASTRTTQLYDRRSEDVEQDEVERMRF